MIAKEEIYLQSKGFVLSNLRDKLLQAIKENEPYFFAFLSAEDFNQRDVTLIKDFFSRNGWVVKEVIPHKDFMAKYAPDKPRSYIFDDISVLVIDLRENFKAYE